MEQLEKKMLKTIAFNLQNSAKFNSQEVWEAYAKRMRQTIEQAMPMFETLLDETDPNTGTPLKLE
jgi:hypothetical protein